MGMVTDLELGKTTKELPNKDMKTKLLKLKQTLDLDLITKMQFQGKK